MKSLRDKGGEAVLHKRLPTSERISRQIHAASNSVHKGCRSIFLGGASTLDRVGDNALGRMFLER
jgi:hypothetical protein